ncbi:MAG TPA: ATP-binding protein, partial [Chitinophagales bacterium]|nr:ATP-binding protein [Chitinophagales bacterium]
MSELIEIRKQDFVKQDTALESMRESDFDCYSAYGEAIDNSIQAKANDIRLKFIPKGGAPGKIGQLIFADNGIGMDKELLHNCLKLGHSSRYNDRDGIGRFGVGMTLGAIHECRRVEVYSKLNNGSWLWTFIDLDEIKSGELKYIPEPIEKEPSSDPTIGGFAEFIEDSGTVLVWRKYDRQTDSLNNIVEETKFWIGRTFRRFIWGTAKGYDNRVQLMVNGDVIKPFDPLFVNKELTSFEDEPSAELLAPQYIKWPIPSDVRKDYPHLGATSNIKINVSLLPDEYRREKGRGGDDFANKRGINRNEGVSIMRSDREVFYGHIPYATRLNGSGEGDRNLTRFIGCVIDFSPELDREFEVKNIKRGCVPSRDLKLKIIEKLAPTFDTQRDKIRERWRELERIKNESLEDENRNLGIDTNHSETIAKLKNAGINQKVNQSKNKASEEGNKTISKKINP